MCNQSNITAHLFSINSWFVCTTTSDGMKGGICNNSMEKLSKEFKNDSRAGLIFHISSLCYLPPTPQRQVSIAMLSCDCILEIQWFYTILRLLSKPWTVVT